MDRERIVASPSASDSNSSVHSQRLRRRDKRRRDNDNASTDHISIVAEVANIYKADLQDSLLALQMPQKNRFLEQSNDFISVHDLLLSQDDYSIPQEQEEAAPVPISELILRDFCSSPTYEEEEDEPIYDSPPWFRFRKKRIKTYSRKPPTRKEPPVATHEDEEDRMSCSSGLSVQEDHTAAAHVPPTTALSELDANSSQKICENLLNLSEYFSLSNPSPKPSKATAGIHKAIAANTSIDLPIKQEATLQRKNVDSDSSVECTTVECASRELGDEPSDVCDNKRPQGNETNTLFGKSGRIRRTCLDSKVCEDWSEGDSFLVTYNTEKMPLDDDEPEQTDNSDEQPTKGSETNDPSTQFTLEDIPISEWQTTMDVPDVSNCKTEAPPDQTVKLEETVKIEAEFLHCISDWEPLDIPEGIAFRTASNKPIEVSEEMQMKAAKLLADVEAGEWKPMDTGESVGFRTASNKTIEVSEENELKAARLLADVQAADQMSKIEISDTQFLQDIHLSQWPAMDVPEAVEFRTASNKCIQISEEMRLKAGDVSKPKPSSSGNLQEMCINECQEMDASEFVGFRTASNKPIQVSEEMQAKAAKLLADLQAPSDAQFLQEMDLAEWEAMDISEVSVNERQPSDIPQKVGFKTASNKQIEVSEEMKAKAAKLIADVYAEPINEPIQKSHQAAPSSGAQEVVDEASVGAAVPLNCDPECQLELSDYHSGDDFKGFQLDDCQPIDLLDLNVFPRQSQKAEHKADSKSVTPKQRRETCEGIPSSKRRRRHADTQKLSTTPQKHGRQLSKTTSCHSALESPIKSQSVPDSLSQLGARSPLDRITKTSVIARRNLLSLSRRRKRVSTVGDECPAQPTDTVTPVKPRFGPMSASTSTPLANRNINIVEEDVSPICMPPQKAPRIGLSRSRY
ncbi:breast cancer type 2 susceptibility protein homolog isoform X2 [Drosophila subobscura]|uniref:breast cancer type 2 susceptibility protein homolog isoform X2 n=1 Tax=Drosophila subobscura TaxID=7241 RepID=UPI00155AC5B5|nr:breast cancer type 2 susceptibility protein homolog isoform X2 [Drosophila subobscura]